MDINNGYDRHLDPPDMDEALYCESCGQEMVECDPTEFYCTNQFCPEKFEKYKGGTISVVLDMANHLAEVEQELADTKSDLKYANARITNLKTRITHLQTEIEDDREVIIKLEKLTQSQQGEE